MLQMHNRPAQFILIAVVAILIGIPSPEGAAQVLEEIVVTAQKREQSLQEVPISVSALSGERIRQTGITKLQDLSVYMPNVQINEATGTDSLFIRGIGSGINMGIEQSVGTVIDGVYYGRARFSRAQFLDIERVEVSKGPQSILFGKNTTSGIINITTANPTDEFEAWITGAYEFNDDEKTVEGALSGPLTDDLSARVAFRYNELDGYIKNITTGRDDPRTDDWTGRVSLLWAPTENFDASAKYQHGEFNKKGRNTVLTQCSPPVTGALAGIGSAEDCVFGDERSAIAPRNTSDIQFGEDQDSDFDIFSLTMNWEVGGHTVTSVTGYSQYGYLDRFVADHLPASVVDIDIDEDYTQWSEEIRIASPLGGRFEYLAGFFYQDTDLDVIFDLHFNFPPTFGGGPVFTQLQDKHQESDMWAVFGQGTWNITDSLSVTFGARYSEEDKAAQTFAGFADALYSTTRGPVVIHDVSADRSESNFTPMGNIRWQATDDIMLYFSGGSGAKGGGYDLLNAFAQTLADTSFEYTKEKVTAYEVGSKMRLLDGAAELNIAVFRSEFTDLQVSALSPTGLIVFFVENAAEATTQGVEVEGRWQVTDRLFVAGNLAVLDSEFDSFPGAACYALQTVAEGCVETMPGSGAFVQDLSGTETQYAPNWGFNLHGEYVWPIAMWGGLEGLIGVDVNYSDDYSLASDNDPNQIQGSYTKVDARGVLRSADGRWELALIGRNLTDKLTTVWGNDAAGGPFLGTYYKHADRLRTIALQATLRF